MLEVGVLRNEAVVVHNQAHVNVGLLGAKAATRGAKHVDVGVGVHDARMGLNEREMLDVSGRVCMCMYEGCELCLM